MGALIRTQSGQFTIETAIKLGDLKTAQLIPVTKVLPYPVISLSEPCIKMAKNGNPIPLELLPQAPNQCWLKGDDKIIGLFKIKSNKLYPEVML